MKKSASISEYIEGFPREVQSILKKIRATIRKTAPNAVESISYGIPTYKLDGSPLIYFAGFKSHIGIYPMTGGVRDKFKKELVGYKGGKGTLQLPLDEPIPFGLIEKIVRFKVKERAAK